MSKPKPKLPTILECEQALKETADRWAGRCYEISCRIVEAGLLPDGASPVYGHWLGPVEPGSVFYKKHKLPFIRHGWVLLDSDEEKVFDPTRWAFEMKEPYLYVGTPPDLWGAVPCTVCDLLEEEHDKGYQDDCGMYQRPAPWPYDEGGDKWRMAARVPLPEENKRERKIKLVFERFEPALFTRELLKKPGTSNLKLDTDFTDVVELTIGHVFWLSNLPYAVLSVHALAIYEALDRAGEGATVPMDNLKRAEREQRVRTSNARTA